MVNLDKEFINQDFSVAFPVGEYENCVFKSCNFSKIELSNSIFINCQFVDCDGSMIKLKGTSFQESTFLNCKLMGVRWEDCKPFLLSFNFKNCILNYSSFFKLKLKGGRFENCQLEEVDFTETDLTKSVWLGSNLLNAKFENTNLTEADFDQAINISIDPELNIINKAKFNSDSLIGLLEKYNIIIQ